MLIAVIDGMGGGIGSQLVTQLVGQLGQKADIVALGTNALATNSMLKAGAMRGATGENAIIVSLRKADIVVGAIGIIAANSLMGEITPRIAEAVASCDAYKVLIPVSQNHFDIVGLENRPLGVSIKEAAAKISGVVLGE